MANVADAAHSIPPQRGRGATILDAYGPNGDWEQLAVVDPTIARVYRPFEQHSPEIVLRLAVIEQAMRDLEQDHAKAHRADARIEDARAYRETRRWWREDAPGHPFSLGAICDALGWDRDTVAGRVLRAVAAGQALTPPRPPTLAERLLARLEATPHAVPVHELVREMDSTVESVRSVLGALKRAGLVERGRGWTWQRTAAPAVMQVARRQQAKVRVRA